MKLPHLPPARSASTPFEELRAAVAAHEHMRRNLTPTDQSLAEVMALDVPK